MFKAFNKPNSAQNAAAASQTSLDGAFIVCAKGEKKSNVFSSTQAYAAAGFNSGPVWGAVPTRAEGFNRLERGWPFIPPKQQTLGKLGYT